MSQPTASAFAGIGQREDRGPCAAQRNAVHTGCFQREDFFESGISDAR
jgi:hypothetical protein